MSYPPHSHTSRMRKKRQMCTDNDDHACLICSPIPLSILSLANPHFVTKHTAKWKGYLASSKHLFVFRRGTFLAANTHHSQVSWVVSWYQIDRYPTNRPRTSGEGLLDVWPPKSSCQSTWRLVRLRHPNKPNRGVVHRLWLFVLTSYYMSLCSHNKRKHQN